MEYKSKTEMKATPEHTKEKKKTDRHCYNLVQVMLRKGGTKAVNGNGQS